MTTGSAINNVYCAWAFCGGFAESCLNRERVRPSVVATPLNSPAAVSVQPVGKVPEVTDHVTLPAPPVLAICC